MILAALALAAALGATPAPAAGSVIHPAPPMAVEGQDNVYHAPKDCADIQRRVSEDQQETLRKLGRLPQGFRQYAVARTVGGCPVPAPVGYHPPALPGAADAPP